MPGTHPILHLLLEVMVGPQHYLESVGSNITCDSVVRNDVNLNLCLAFLLVNFVRNHLTKLYIMLRTQN